MSSTEIYPVVQGQARRSSLIFDHGKALGHFHSELAWLAEAMQVAPLMTFYNMSRDEAVASLGEDVVGAIETGAELEDGE